MIICFILITNTFYQLLRSLGGNRYSSLLGPEGLNHLLQYLSDATKTEWKIETGNQETITSEGDFEKNDFNQQKEG